MRGKRKRLTRTDRHRASEGSRGPDPPTSRIAPAIPPDVSTPKLTSVYGLGGFFSSFPFFPFGLLGLLPAAAVPPGVVADDDAGRSSSGLTRLAVPRPPGGGRG